MAENEQQQQERTEQATPKRLEEARKRGQIARSRELNMAAVMIIGALALYAGQPRFGGFFIELMTRGLSFNIHGLHTPESIIEALSQAGLSAVVAFAPFLAAATVAAILGGVAIGGWSFSPSPMAPKFSKLDPIKGLKRVFGLRGLVETGKAHRLCEQQHFQSKPGAADVRDVRRRDDGRHYAAHLQHVTGGRRNDRRAVSDLESQKTAPHDAQGNRG
jgi:flagellar biosynthesis protein FlhB